MLKKLWVFKGFSMAEALIAFMLIGLALAATVPLMTQMSQLRTGVDKNTVACIIGESFADSWVNMEEDEENPPKWYDEETGATSIPMTPPDRETELLKNQCHAAILDNQFDRGKAVDTAIWYAKHGTDSQKLIAKKILRASCDKGGKKACDYFINTCWHEGAPSCDPNKMYCYCDDVNTYLDLTYYLHLNKGTNTNPGAEYIKDRLEGMLPKMIKSLVNEVSYAKDNEQLPKGDSYHPPKHLGENIASELAVAQIYIRGCNLGFDAACKVAWDPDDDGDPSDSYNTSCTVVKENWKEAPTGNYRLTYPGNPVTHEPVEVFCNMSSDAWAAVSGCNADPPVPYDCKDAREKNLNKTCYDLYRTLSSFGCGEYTLTAEYEDPSWDVSKLKTKQYCCNRPGNQCILDGIGSVCDDGTIYAGEYNNYYYFIGPNDEDNLSLTDDRMEFGVRGCKLDANNDIDGMVNQQIILSWLNQNCILYDDYDATKACAEWLNVDTTRNHGYTDWYLPARNELLFLYGRKDIGSLSETFPTNTYYWSSTELQQYYSIAIDFNTGKVLESTEYDDAYDFIRKDLLRNVRCIRKQEDLNAECPNAGDTCPDETIYVGMHGGKHVFTMPQNEVGVHKWGAESISIPGADNRNDGYQNYLDVVNGKRKTITSLPAAQVCKRKNDNLEYTHDDWYLPASKELKFLCDNKDNLSSFFGGGGDYFSSTENTKLDVFQVSWSNCALTTVSKDSYPRRVHCVRKEPKQSY